jgi:glycerol uptake facilitator-like aquaporin
LCDPIHLNPNVSTALVLCGVITPVRFVLYCVAQLAGGVAAAGLVLALLPGPIASIYSLLLLSIAVLRSLTYLAAGRALRDLTRRSLALARGRE